MRGNATFRDQKKKWEHYGRMPRSFPRKRIHTTLDSFRLGSSCLFVLYVLFSGAQTQTRTFMNTDEGGGGEAEWRFEQITSILGECLSRTDTTIGSTES
jgi:hypothetical protein